MPPRCLTSGQSLRYVSSHSMCACICVYLLSDLCNPCFNSVSSSSGAVTIHFLHFFQSLSLSLSPWGYIGALGNCAFIHQFAPLCPLYVFLWHTQAHTLLFSCQRQILVSQSESERKREWDWAHFCDKREELFFTGRSICLSWLVLFLSQSDICISPTLLHSNAFITLTGTRPSHSLNEAHTHSLPSSILSLRSPLSPIAVFMQSSLPWQKLNICIAKALSGKQREMMQHD